MIGLVFAVDDGLRPAALPLVAGILIAAGFFSALSLRSVVTPIAELGTTFVAAVSIYLILPIAVFLLLGGTYTVLNDNRLLQLQPSVEDVAASAWLYVAFLGSFAAVYLLRRGNAEPRRLDTGIVSRQRLIIFVTIYVAFSVLSPLLVGRVQSESYEGVYAAIGALPLVARQFLKLWEGWAVLLTIGVRIWLFQDFARYRWVIAAWIGSDILFVVSALQSRTGLAITLVSSVLLYHLLVRPIRVRTALLGIVVGLGGFLALGLARAYRGFGTFGLWSIASAGGEFESLFANVIDLRYRLGAGEIGSLPFSFHFADLLAPFPSQIVPFQKYDPGAWYIGTFYPEAAERGLGVAWGVIAQGVVGFGWMELVARGAILGYAFASFHRYFSRNSQKFWVLVMYVWMTVWSYQSFRNQSFILLTFIFQWFLSLVFVVEVAVRVFRHTAERQVGTPIIDPS